MNLKFLFSLLCAVALLQARSDAAKPALPDASTLMARVERIAEGPGHAVLDAAMRAYERARNMGEVSKPTLLTVIDYTRPSTEPRLWVLDLVAGRILHRELVAHGRNSGDNLATDFSNEEGSLKTSLGLFVTDHTYQGQNGYSLRLRGLDPGVNDNAFARAIVMHGASYVSQAITKQLGRLGRSWGCPAIRSEIAQSLIDLIKDGTVVYAYGPQSSGASPGLTATSVRAEYQKNPG